QGNVRSSVAGIVDLGFRVLHQHFEIAAVLEFGADTFGILVEFGGVVGLGENVFEEDGVRNPDWPEVLHGRAQGAVIDVLIAAEADLTDPDLGAFLDDKRDAHGRGRNRPDFGTDGGKLAPVLGKQRLDHHFGPFDPGGIVLALDREAHFAILEAVEDVAGGDRTQAGVIDLADGGPLLDVDVKDPAFGALLALKSDVLEVAGIPESVEIAFQSGGVVDVANLCEDAGSHRVRGDAAVSMDLDADDQVSLPESGCDNQQGSDQAEQAEEDGTMAPGFLTGGNWSAAEVPLRARVAAEGQNPHRDILMTAMNCNYLERRALGKR